MKEIIYMLLKNIKVLFINWVNISFNHHCCSGISIWKFIYLFQVLLIGGSTGTMLEALDVVGGDTHSDSSLASVGPITVSFARNDSYGLLLFIFLCILSP